MRFPQTALLASAIALALACGSSALAQPAPSAAAAARGGLDAEREAELSQTHDGYYGALAPQNLHKPRPKAPDRKSAV